MSERTFVMVKPDGVGRRLIGECIRRYEKRGLKLVAMKMRLLSRKLVETHYEEHRGRPYYSPLVDFMLSGPVVQMVWEGVDAVNQARRINGATNSIEAALGTIRGDLALSNRHNLVHAADAPASAEREIALYFSEEELLHYPMPDEHWLV